MRKEDQLLQKYGRQTGMKVPEGYFEDFSKQLMSRLPEYPEAPRPQPLSRWQRIKPYVYLAAMFAGIWCMMKMFHIASQNAAEVALDNPPANVVLALENPESDIYFFDSDDMTADFEIQENISETYDNIEDFEADFDYALSPEYASLQIPVSSLHEPSPLHS